MKALNKYILMVLFVLLLKRVQFLTFFKLYLDREHTVAMEKPRLTFAFLGFPAEFTGHRFIQFHTESLEVLVEIRGL